MASKLGVSRGTIARDKKRLREKNLDELKEGPVEEALLEIKGYMESVTDEYWKIIHGDDVSDSVKVSALNHLWEVVQDKIKLLQSLGVIKEEPLKIEKQEASNNVEEALEELNEELTSIGKDEDRDLSELGLDEIEEMVE